MMGLTLYVPAPISLLYPASGLGLEFATINKKDGGGVLVRQTCHLRTHFEALDEPVIMAQICLAMPPS